MKAIGDLRAIQRARRFFAILIFAALSVMTTELLAQESQVDDNEFWKRSGANSEQAPVDEKADRDVASQGNTRGAAKAGAGNKARYRLYPGGQDEQEIEVQKSLPAPVREAGGSANASGLPSGMTVEH